MQQSKDVQESSKKAKMYLCFIAEGADYSSDSWTPAEHSTSTALTFDMFAQSLRLQKKKINN